MTAAIEQTEQTKDKTDQASALRNKIKKVAWLIDICDEWMKNSIVIDKLMQ